MPRSELSAGRKAFRGGDRAAAVFAAAVLACGVVLVGAAPKAGAFAEDICYSTAGLPASDCATLPRACSLTEPVTPACGVAALARMAVGTARPGTGRSLVHTDATYIMARAVGFSAEDAYWIAAYDEATDLGTFAPTNVDGTPAPRASALTTSDISGLTRTNFNTGGLLFHFVATVKDSPDQQPDGLHPDVHDAEHEVMIVHLRRWALAGPGGSAPLCTGGFTVPSASGDLATGPTCYGGAHPVPIRGLLSVDSPVAVPFATETGLQVISGDVRSDRFDSWVGGGNRAADARIGVYLHALADRISHHRCTDAAEIEAPSKTHVGFRADMDNAECDQGVHAVRHLYETGVPFDQLDPTDRTTSAALRLIYTELVEFARARHTLDAGAATSQAEQDLVDAGLVPALQVPDAIQRMTAVAAVGCGRGIAAFPGAPVCRTRN